MNFRKASIFQRDTEKPEVQNDSGGVLAVWGSPGSGKTITAVKIAKMLSAKKKNVILLLCDMSAPMLPCICHADALESKGSLAGVLAAARISENLIKHNLVTFKRNSCLAVLGLLERQNEYSTPPFTQKQVVELLDGLRQPCCRRCRSTSPVSTPHSSPKAARTQGTAHALYHQVSAGPAYRRSRHDADGAGRCPLFRDGGVWLSDPLYLRRRHWRNTSTRRNTPLPSSAVCSTPPAWCWIMPALWSRDI